MHLFPPCFCPGLGLQLDDELERQTRQSNQFLLAALRDFHVYFLKLQPIMIGNEMLRRCRPAPILTFSTATLLELIAVSIQMGDVEKFKSQGNDAFKRGHFNEAIDAWSKAIDLEPSAALYSNRAFAYLRTEGRSHID